MKTEYDAACGILAAMKNGARPTVKDLQKLHPSWNKDYCRGVIALAKQMMKGEKTK